MSGKYALIIGNTEYIDSGLAQLSAPGKDAEDFARVLKDTEIGAFDDVKVVVNEPSAFVIEAIDEFFDQKKPDDMLVLYFSGHGIRDEIGSLYLAFKNTIRSRLRSTAIKSDYIKEAMDQSRSKRQVLILDCCNSGAFPQGTKAELGGSMGMTQAFQGYGRFVLTASDATQFAWEGDKVIGETDNSLFTHFLVKGLEGEADSDGDGKITVDELYDYAYYEISRVTPKQTPTKSTSKQEGEIILRQNMRMEDIRAVPLPAALLDSLENPFPDVRLGAVQQIARLLNGKNLGLARSAREVLERIEQEDDSRQVSRAATQALESIRQAEELAKQKETENQKEREEAERSVAIREAEVQRLLHERAVEAERQEKEKAERFATQKTEEESIAKAKIESARLAEEKRQAREKVDAEQKAKALSTHETAEKVLVRPRNIPGSQTKTRQPILKWVLIGTIGLCVLGTGVWGASSLLSGLGEIPPTQTEASVQQTQIPTQFPNTPITNNNMEVLISAAQQEGTLNVIALPHDWCNYGEMIETFKSKYGIEINELNPDAGSSDQLEAIRVNKENNGPQAPDVIDVGFLFVESAKAEGLLMPYKVSNWGSIPDEVKDPSGYWYGNYYGVISFLVNTDIQPNIPQDWEDLLSHDYGPVALSGDPRTSTQARQSVLAAALAIGGTLDNARPGLDFFAELYVGDLLVPLISNNSLVASGETPIRITWDYNALVAIDSFAGNPQATVIIPKSGRLGSIYVEAISAYAPHPNAAKLWMEFLYSDEGQLLWMEAYCHPIRESELRARGVVPADLVAKIPDVSGVVFPTIDQLNTANTLIAENWDAVVGADIQATP